MEHLLREGVTPARVASLVEKQGIAFEVTAEVEAQLRQAGAVDIGGPWFVEETATWDLGGGGSLTRPCQWDATQAGTDLTIDFTCRTWDGSLSSGVLVGTIDPDAGTFSVSLPDTVCEGGVGTYVGSVAPDGKSFSGTYECGGFPAIFTFVGGLCRNGVLDSGESCDGGLKLEGGCCDDTCQPRSAQDRRSVLGIDLPDGDTQRPGSVPRDHPAARSSTAAPPCWTDPLGCASAEEGTNPSGTSMRRPLLVKKL